MAAGFCVYNLHKGILLKDGKPQEMSDDYTENIIRALSEDKETIKI